MNNIGKLFILLFLFAAGLIHGLALDSGEHAPADRGVRFSIDADSGHVAYYGPTTGPAPVTYHRVWRENAAERRRMIALLHRRGADKDLTDFEVVLKHHYGPAYHVEKSAYARVFDLKDHVEAIAGRYEHLSPELLMAVIKEESQGLRCAMSHKAAIGLSQIKYQGAFTFAWNAMFRDRVKVKGRMRPDHFNRNIRKRYGPQLSRIKAALEDGGMLMKRKNDLEARRLTWRKLKAHVRRGCGAVGYPADVEIAALYLDHLIHVFGNLREKALDIRAEIRKYHGPDIRELDFSGTKRAFWREIAKAAEAAPSPEAARGMIVRRLAHFIDIADDPRAWYAAYHAGPTHILNRIFRGDRLPEDSAGYAARVEAYENVFEDLYLSDSRLLYSRRTPSPDASASL